MVADKVTRSSGDSSGVVTVSHYSKQTSPQQPNKLTSKARRTLARKDTPTMTGSAQIIVSVEEEEEGAAAA
eukprot:401446-Pyramimonas_sp.AAC.2